MIFQQVRILAPFLSRSSLASLDLSPEDKDKKNQLLDKWEFALSKYHESIQKERGVQQHIEMKDLSPRFTNKVSKLIQDERFRSKYANRIFEIRMVEIDKLIVLQGIIYTEFVEALETQFSSDVNEEAVFDWCMRLDQEKAPVSHLQVEPNKFVYSSDSMDLRLIDMTSRESNEMGSFPLANVGLPSNFLVLSIGQGTPLVWGMVTPNGVVLGNGFHRLYALRKNNVTHVPMLLIKDTTIQDLRGVTPNRNVENIITDPRPLLFKDFFNSDLTFDVKLKPRKRSVTITVQSDVTDIPM